jgi:DDE superfamily endonuclease
VSRRRKGGDHSLSAIKSIRAARPDGAPIYVIMDNLSANKTPAVRAWAARHKVELCLTPTYASWANPIEAQFGPLRTFTMGASDHPNHPALARRLQAYLRWRNTHARHPDVHDEIRVCAELGHDRARGPKRSRRPISPSPRPTGRPQPIDVTARDIRVATATSGVALVTQSDVDAPVRR